MATRVQYETTLPASAQLVVIGAGVVGAATAFWASRAGIRTVVVERRPLPCTLTTPVAPGAFRLQFDNREELELVTESVNLFLNFAELTNQNEYTLDIKQRGYLFVTTTPEGIERQRRAVGRQRDWGLTDVELLGPEELRVRFPHVGANVLQGRFRQGDGFLDAKQLTFGLLAASNVQVVTRCEVIGFQERDGRLSGVYTSMGTIQTEMAVIAAGPFSGPVARLCGIELPVETVQRQKIIMPEVPEAPPAAPTTIDEDTCTLWRPALSGAYLVFTDPETPSTPPTEDVPPNHRTAFRLMDPASPVSVARVTPFWKQVWKRGARDWIIQAGQYTMTPDHRPLIGPTELEGLFVNSGYSGHGIMGSPAGSRILIEVLTQKLAREDNPFRLQREWVAREQDIL